ncbi:uncharacterized protein LOC108680375 [Hyalella azteca]|uniref:Uncharacterized protein LOC108680375 n=1 Tax=Hyalella azteca TaxID=294128 RepID=A0A8B7PGH8_HYAAZ|nr:uncharacterized protein LOC108680375 [Hyalella azteca]
MKSFASFSLALLAVLVSVSAGKTERAAKATSLRHYMGYTGPSQTGVHFDFLTYDADLNLVGLDNQIRSACQAGLWMVYENIEYNYFEPGNVCIVPALEDCFDLSAACSGMVSSLRYAGSSEGMNDDFYNMYGAINYQGLEFKGNNTSRDVGILQGDVSSVIVSGTGSWTFYTDREFNGASVCVVPDSKYLGSDGTALNYGLFQNLGELGLSDGGIGSLIKGCFSDTVVSAEAVRAKREAAASAGLA